MCGTVVPYRLTLSSISIEYNLDVDFFSFVVSPFISVYKCVNIVVFLCCFLLHFVLLLLFLNSGRKRLPIHYTYENENQTTDCDTSNEKKTTHSRTHTHNSK